MRNINAFISYLGYMHNVFAESVVDSTVILSKNHRYKKVQKFGEILPLIVFVIVSDRITVEYIP
jgi:hypothetical protein